MKLSSKLKEIKERGDTLKEKLSAISKELEKFNDYIKSHLKEFDTSHPISYYTVTLANLYEKQGYIEDAIFVYKKILEKEPDNKEAIEGLKRCNKLKEQV